MSKLNSAPLITCFEYQRLVSEDFEFQKDFDYLVSQELPCFDVGVKQGRIYLQVRHYLAKIILPSGTTLEILPKINTDAKAKNEVALTRQWVRQMLVDLAEFDLQKVIPAINLSASMNSSADLETFSESVSDATLNNDPEKNYSHAPWYDWLLDIAEDKIGLAENVLPNVYHKNAHNSPKAKGKLNLSEQFKTNWYRPHYLYSEQSVFQVDDLLKKFLATGWQQVQWLKNGNKVINNINEFGKVTLLPVSLWHKTYSDLLSSQSSWRTQLSPMQCQVLSEALSWCWWVLNHLLGYSSHLKNKTTANCSAKTLPYPAFMINMNHAFESWVLSRLKGWVAENLPKSELIVQPSFNWLQETSRGNVIQKLQPDACIESENRQTSHVIDIKYKNINKVQDISTSDWQQLSVYKQYLQADYGWLIFPMTTRFQDKIDVSNIKVKPVKTVDKMSAIAFNMVSRTFIGM